MINTLLLDFAGVLTREEFLSVLARNLKKKFEVDEDLFKQLFRENEAGYLVGRISAQDFWQMTCGGFNVPYDEYVDIFSSSYELNEGMLELLGKLKRDYRLFMVSDNFEILAHSVKTDPALSGIFERIFLSNETKLTKRTPGCFEYILKEIRKKPEECLFTDDKAANLVLAEKLGLTTLLFRSFSDFKCDLKRLKIGEVS